VKYGHVVIEICEWKDSETYRHEDHNTLHSLKGDVISAQMITV